MTDTSAFRDFGGKHAFGYLFPFLNAITIAAILAHIAVLLLVGNKANSPWSGGGDAGIYINLAQNIATGRGYTFAGTPTASRAPLYPLLVAGLMVLWPLKWRFVLRAVQLCCALCTAFACGALAKKCSGQGAVGFLFGLLMPTLLFFQSEILTESVAAMLIALWWLYLSESLERQSLFPVLLAGIFAGLASLERFNALPLILLGPFFIALVGRNYRRALLTLSISCMIVAPWIVHNWHAFGRPLYSTLSGFALVDGVLSPTGRGNVKELAVTRSRLGWFNGDVESNSAPPELRNELTLDTHARELGRELWGAEGFKGILKLVVVKFGAFWLSTDQILATSTFALRVRILRWCGVLLYFIFLALAIAGWFYLRRANSSMAWLIVVSAVVITAFHLPVTMNTRLRAPFFDPLIASLAAIGVSTIKYRLDALPKTPEESVPASN